jgi:F0F1-type ATP synthase assembly protein I
MVDDRSPTAKAMSIASQITTVGLVAVMPIVMGSWVDNWLATKPIFILIGVVLGFVAAGFQLMRLVRSLNQGKNRNITD